MPLLQSRWPAAAVTLSRAARFSGELLALANEEVDKDLAQVRCEGTEALSVKKLRAIHSIRLRHLLRRWISNQGIPMPSSKKMARMEQEVIFSRPDATPLVTWAGWSLRRYRDQLMLLPHPSSAPPQGPLIWSDKQHLELPNGLGVLQVRAGHPGLCAARWKQANVEIRFRCGGERCQPAGSKHHRALKKLFQEWGIPPWERDYQPLVYLDGELALIPGRVVCQPFLASEGEAAIEIYWQRCVRTHIADYY
jgi:tRNA(Ile)-lysidine synthase